MKSAANQRIENTSQCLVGRADARAEVINSGFTIVSPDYDLARERTSFLRTFSILCAFSRNWQACH
jgi:hypothetical protein